MTDPFSVVTGVVGIVGVALSNTRQVYDFISGIKGAPETVATLPDDLNSLANILQQLCDLTKDPSRALFVVPLKGSLERCIAALKQLELTVKPYVEGLQNGKSKWKRFAWNFKEKEVTVLQVRLGSCRDNLQLAILLGVMMQQASGSEDIRVNFQKLQRTAEGDRWSVAGSAVPSSGPQGSDYGYALKRFLLKHESELGSQLGNDPISDEFKDEPVAGLISGGVLLERAVPPDIVHRSVSPGRSQQEFGQASGENDAPERKRSDAAFKSARQEDHADIVFASQIGSTAHSRNLTGIASETASLLQRSPNALNGFKPEVREMNQRLRRSEYKVTSLRDQRQLSLLSRKSRRESPQVSSRLQGTAGQRQEAICEEQIMQEILADPLLEGIHVESLTEQEQEELSERLAEAYRQRRSTLGPLLRPSTRAECNTQIRENASAHRILWEPYLRDVPTHTLDLEAPSRAFTGPSSQDIRLDPIRLASKAQLSVSDSAFLAAKGRVKEEEDQGPLYKQEDDHDEAQTELRRALPPRTDVANFTSGTQQRALTVEEVRARIGDTWVDLTLNKTESVEEALQAFAVALASPEPLENLDIFRIWLVRQNVLGLEGRLDHAQLLMLKKELLPTEWRDRLHMFRAKITRIHEEFALIKMAQFERSNKVFDTAASGLYWI